MSRKSIAETLKEKRKGNKLSVKVVSEKLEQEYGIKVSDKTLYSYEIGHRQPDADTLLALCVIYGVSDVLSAFGYKEDEQQSPESVRVARAYDSAKQGAQESVRKLLDVDSEEQKGEDELSVLPNIKEA